MIQICIALELKSKSKIGKICMQHYQKLMSKQQQMKDPIIN